MVSLNSLELITPKRVAKIAHSSVQTAWSAGSAPFGIHPESAAPGSAGGQTEIVQFPALALFTWGQRLTISLAWAALRTTH
mmetsp:Transcript_27305/g.71434  ORF Transcript_27305/g.71434 Transcript_27305/m.71434 type:complete len:81 (+) Transcript_27305:310-552(+)